MRLGPYELLGELGRGGMGVVHRARAPGGELVAVKVLLRLESEKEARFDRERRLLETLSESGGFVPLLDAGSSEHGPYVVMPLVGGGTLRARLRLGTLGVAETATLGVTLAEALARAHERGIVHRDLKPENILFTEDGAPLIADLGLAKHFDRVGPGASQSISVSTHGNFRGTAGYMAPEQAADAKSAGPAADVFSLGAILYECLTGAPPFAGESLFDVVSRAAEGRFEPVRSRRPDAPEWLAAAIAKALAVKVADRFRDAGALAAALRSNGRTRGRPGRLLLAAVLTGGALVAASTIAAAMRPRGDSRPAAPAPPASSIAPSASAIRAEALVKQGCARGARGDWDGALAAFDEAVALDPTSTNALANRGSARIQKGDHEGAISDLDRVLERDPKCGKAWLDRSGAKSRLGDLAGALADCDKVQELDPNNPEVLRYRAVIKRMMKDLTGARADLDRAIVIAPSLAGPLGERGAVRAESGDLEGALRDFDASLRRDPENALVLSNRGYAHTKRGDLRQAVADYDRSLELAPDRVSTLNERALAKKALGDGAGAIADLERVLALGAAGLDAAAIRGALDALRTNRGMAGLPTAADAQRVHELLGRARERFLANELDGAVALYDDAIRTAPRLAVAWRGRGLAKAQRGDLEGALEDLDRSIELDPADAAALQSRAIFKSRRKDLDGALADVDRALELDPSYAPSWSLRGSVRVLREDLPGAIADYERCLVLDPDSPEAPGVRRWLDGQRAPKGR